MEQNPSNKTNIAEQRAFEIKRRLYGRVYLEIVEYLNAYKDEGDYEKLIAMLLGFMANKGIPELQEQLSKKLTNLKPHITNLNVEKVITSAIIEVIGENLTLEEIEAGSRESQFQKGYALLSRGLSYEVIEPDGGDSREINLHVPTTFFNNPEEAIESAKEGLRNLAQILSVTPELDDIQEIFGVSELVSKKSHIIRKLGFEVDEKEGNALISREKLFELYGKRNAEQADLKEALAKAYDAMENISFEGMQYRKDIGKKSLL